MTVKTYKPRRLNNPFEKEVFQYLSSVLERAPDEYILFGPVRIDNRELDGLIIGNGFMVALEAKAVHGRVSMSVNSPVTVTTYEGETVAFEDRYEDPYDQAENHWKKLGTFIRNTFGETDFWFVTMLVFQPGCTFDVPASARDVYSGNSLIVALDEVPAYLNRLSSRLARFELSEEQQDALIKAVTEGANKLSRAEKQVFARSSPPPGEVPVTYTSTPPSTPLPRKIPPASPKRGEQTGAWEEETFLPRKRWYQSPWFLWLAFFFLNPLWAFIMLRDRTRSWFVKLIATLFLLTELLACLGGLYLLQTCPQCLNFALPFPALPGTPPPVATASSTTPALTSALPVQTQASPEAEGACTIAWVETVADGLANKNRADVWQETVRHLVAGSGMTDRQFYDQVVERNPVLEADGYVFMEGKTYFLPQCE